MQLALVNVVLNNRVQFSKTAELSSLSNCQVHKMDSIPEGYTEG
jgi:hypothetical protein